MDSSEVLMKHLLALRPPTQSLHNFKWWHQRQQPYPEAPSRSPYKPPRRCNGYPKLTTRRGTQSSRPHLQRRLVAEAPPQPGALGGGDGVRQHGPLAQREPAAVPPAPAHGDDGPGRQQLRDRQGGGRAAPPGPGRGDQRGAQVADGRLVLGAQEVEGVAKREIVVPHERGHVHRFAVPAGDGAVCRGRGGGWGGVGGGREGAGAGARPTDIRWPSTAVGGPQTAVDALSPAEKARPKGEEGPDRDMRPTSCAVPCPSPDLTVSCDGPCEGQCVRRPGTSTPA